MLETQSVSRILACSLPLEMPSSASRSCGLLNYLFMWLAKLTASLTRRPAAPELPLSTLDLHTHDVVETPSVPEDGTFVLSSHWQREPGLPRHRYADELTSDSRSSAYSSAAPNSQVDSTKAHEFASLFAVSPTLSPQSPLLATATPPSIHMSPTYSLQSPEMCTSLLNSEPASSGDVVDPSSCSASELASIGELGKRRGFKGAPLFTPEAARRPSTSFLSLSSAFSPKFPLSPRPSPSTPRSPLSNVTNRMRTSTARSPGRSPAKSSRPLAMQMEPPVSEELQQCYDVGDPFSVVESSFFAPEIVCASVPLPDLERFDVYRTATHKAFLVRGHKRFSKAIQAASRKRETNVYDMMVYNFQPKVSFGKKKTRKLTPLHHISLVPSTMARLPFLSEEPRVHLPRHIGQDREVLSEDVGLAHSVPPDFCRSLRPILFSDPQNVIVNMRAAAAPQTASCRHTSSRHFTDATTDTGAISTRRQSSVLGDLLALLDNVVIPDQAEEVDGRTELRGDRVEFIVVAAYPLDTSRVF
ncbi:hypothetical protein B0H17DRAFT_242063 [Mycena rosella]|uniref:Uncharacterized protein n=1 Tax=Mycena rosella TaxID=1033263 RepID=A0AAD7H155_MYCRO|nr:hypothetical protein B0H17DRAFT_242063 [Mycena rosella]